MATDKTSMARLNECHPSIREKAIAAYTEACRITPVGVHPFITEAYRSFKRSDELYAQGRTKSGSIVSNSKAGQSYHNYGMGIDYCLQINGKTSWKVDANWRKVAEVFKKYGFDWGGDYKGSFKDYPHVEYKKYGTWQQMLVKWNNGDTFIQDGIKYVNL